MPTEDERRLHPRIDATLQVRSRLLEPSELPLLASSLGRADPVIPQLSMVKAGSRVTHLASINLSLGGLSTSGDLQIEADKAYAKGADVVVEFDLGDGQPAVRAVAQVMWTTHSGTKMQMGLMFLLITDSAFMRIQDFVQRKLKS